MLLLPPSSKTWRTWIGSWLMFSLPSRILNGWLPTIQARGTQTMGFVIKSIVPESIEVKVKSIASVRIR